MAFRDVMKKARTFFGPGNTFFNGAAEEEPAQETASAFQPAMPQQGYAPQQAAFAQQYRQPAYGQPYAPQQQPYPPQQGYQPPQAGYPQQPQAGYAQPQPGYQPPQQAPYAAPQQQAFAERRSPLQQGYQPPQEAAFVPQRNRRAAQHQQGMENMVPFPAAASAPAPQPQSETTQQPAPSGKQPAACVVNVRGISDCRSAIGILRAGDCVLAVMDNIADQAEVRRYVDTLNGACFSLGCTMTRLSARVGVYLLAPVGMQVFTDQATTQMNSQSRAPQRPRPAQGTFRPAFQPPAQSAYQQPYPPQQAQPVFAPQQPAQGYAPDGDGGEYTDAVM